jgi:hypothetical protein
MDETRVENALNALLESAARTDERLSRMESTTTGMATKVDFAELRQAVMHYANNVEEMLNSLSNRSKSR